MPSPTLPAVAPICDQSLPDTVFIEELSRRIGKSEDTIRTYARPKNKKYHHLIPQPVRRFHGSRRLYWLHSDVLAWMRSNEPASPPPPRRPRGRPTKAEQLQRARWTASQKNEVVAGGGQ